MIFSACLSRVSLATAIAVCWLPTLSLASTFTTSNLNDAGTWNTIYAQGFSPSINSMPDPGLSGIDSVTLQSFAFFKSGFGDTASDIQLAILDTFYYDFNTTLTTVSTELVGLSDNVIASTASIATGDPILFNFTGVSLAYGQDYGAVYVSDDGSGNLTPVTVSSLTANYTESSPGNFTPMTNYGTESEFQYTTSGFISGSGFFSGFGAAGDSKFEAVIASTPVPEPSTGLAIGVMIALSVSANRLRNRI